MNGTGGFWEKRIGGRGGIRLKIPKNVKYNQHNNELLDTWIQATTNDLSPSASEGFFKLWRGAGPTVTRAVVGGMSELPVYDEIKHQLIDRDIIKGGLKLHLTCSLSAISFLNKLRTSRC